jgi:hypothetical protein
LGLMKAEADIIANTLLIVWSSRGVKSLVCGLSGTHGLGLT